MAYASSQDGNSFSVPKLDLYELKGSKQNNIVYRGPNDSRASGLQLLTTMPKEDMKGYRFVMTYRTGGAGKGNDGIRLVGSNDCIHWDEESDTLIKPNLHSDMLNSIVYDPVKRHYLMSCRSKDRYRRFQGETMETGASRRVAVIRNPQLWSTWEGHPQQVLIPDELDLDRGYTLFYGMPMHWYGGLTLGYLWPFKLNDPIYTELAFSRDGERWTRFHHRTALVERGEEGTWDDGMVFGCPPWVEVGDEWWHYYAGHDDGHRSVDRRPGIGLAIGRKEGFVSMTGPSGGGVVVTRLIRWPGGDLLLNLDASSGRACVRVSDAKRDPLEGFDYTDCGDISVDAIRHKVQWNGRSLKDLAGQSVRLEILLQNADLYSLQAEK